MLTPPTRRFAPRPAQYSWTHSHWAAKRSLSEWLTEHGIPAMYGADTRMLTKKIRETGAMCGKIEIDSLESIPFDDPNKVSVGGWMVSLRMSPNTLTNDLPLVALLSAPTHSATLSLRSAPRRSSTTTRAPVPRSSPTTVV